MHATISDLSAEGILLLGGARAILLQLADPAVGRGVARHSDFEHRPLDRLHGTLTYLYVTVYGTEAERARMARDVGAAHRPVRGEGYDARDAGLQLWVAATLYDSAMRVREQIWGPLPRAEANNLLAEYALLGTALGMPRDLWPSDVDAFDEYFTSHELCVDEVTRGVATALLYSRALPWWMRVLLPSIRTITAGMLSPALRHAYGLEHSERHYRRMLAVLRAVYPRLPRWVRTAPQRHYLRRFRAAG